MENQSQRVAGMTRYGDDTRFYGEDAELLGLPLVRVNGSG